MHEELHAANFIWQGFSLFGRRSVYPVIEESLEVDERDDETMYVWQTVLEKDTRSVFGTIFRPRRVSRRDAAASLT
jgi:hypothetical protein